MRTSRPLVGSKFAILTSLTAFFTFYLIVVGAVVRVSGSGLGCPDWPLCHGSLIPPFEFHTLVEYSHRLSTTLVSLFVILTAVVAALRYRSQTWIFRGALLAVALLVVQILLGGITVLLELPPTVVAIHLGNAMLLLATLLTVATMAWRANRETGAVQMEKVEGNAGRSAAAARSDGLVRLALASAFGVFVIILSGSVVEGSGAAAACPSWPLCSGASLLSPGILPFIHMLHRAIVGVAGLLALYTFYRAIKTRAGDRAIFIVALLGSLFLITQVLVGALNVWLEFPPAFEGLHVALAAAVWGSLVVLVQLVRPRQAVREQEIEGSGGMRRKPVTARVAEYFALTKPWIAGLLLTTTFAAMLVAARGLPQLNLLALTLLGGACAAGGANAFNSYLDRDIDKQMGRTSRRPLPSGRVSPRGALIFAVTISLLSIVILGFGVNWLSAILSTVGLVYYAFIYTVLLKRATPQNIVVGGVAGAIPPLVGWAAVTGNVSLLALYLFSIVLLWTPPHTWALMMLLEKDYSRVKIPMLPVAWGELEARRQIILYSILLVVITLIPFLIGALGDLYVLGAIALGAYFLQLALRLWREPAPHKHTARRLYYFSNAYLALLFLAMVLDHWFALLPH